jgi:hypothetical protein
LPDPSSPLHVADAEPMSPSKASHCGRQWYPGHLLPVYSEVRWSAPSWPRDSASTGWVRIEGRVATRHGKGELWRAPPSLSLRSEYLNLSLFSADTLSVLNRWR